MASDVTRRLTMVEVPLRTSMVEDIFVSVLIAQVGAWRRVLWCCRACRWCTSRMLSFAVDITFARVM
jgi:hypothetical protein